MTAAKHPEIEVAMVGEDGNAFAVIGRVHREMRKHGLSQRERDEFFADATASGSYDELLACVMRWVEVR